jgi:hypothetical protein
MPDEGVDIYPGIDLSERHLKQGPAFHPPQLWLARILKRRHIRDKIDDPFMKTAFLWADERLHGDEKGPSMRHATLGDE